MPEFESIDLDQHDGVLKVTLSRPKANAFDNQMASEFQRVLKDAGRNDSVRCLLLTGAGRFFSAGQDVAAFRGRAGSLAFREHLQATYNPIILRMRSLEKPIVGAINGPAAGAALGIVLATDVRIAGESARFVFGFTGIGLTCDSGTSLTLPRTIGMARASWMAFTNDPLTASEALEFGLVNQVVPDDQLAQAAAELADRLAQGPTVALGLTKRAFNRTMMPELEAVLDYEAHLQDAAGETEDHQTGVEAFLNKEPVSFQGR